MDLSSLLFINLTTAVIHGDDLHCWAFMSLNDDCSLELEWKCTLLDERNVRKSEKNECPVSAEHCFWPAFKHSDIACLFTANVQ